MAELVEASPSALCPAASLLPVLPPSSPLPADSLTSALVALDPATGQILALSSKGASDNQAALSSLDTGTLVTPFIYLNAFSRGFNPSTLVWDVTQTEITHTRWPLTENRGPISLREAMTGDALSPTVDLLTLAGIPSFTKLMNSLNLSGISSDPFPSLSTDPVSLARAYGMLADSGTLAGTQPVYILQILDSRRNSLYQVQDPANLAVVSPQLSYLVNQVLADDSIRDPALAPFLNTSADTAVKVGRVADGRSAWTSGYTSSLVILSRLASVDGSTTIDLRWPASVWRAIMQYSLTSHSAAPWLEPPGISHVTVCYPSGLLPDADCPETRPGIFITGNEPNRTDDLYQTAWVNVETNRLATVFTPPELMQARRYLLVPPDYAGWAADKGIPQMPVNYDPIPPQKPDPGLHITTPAFSAQVSGVVAVTGTTGGVDFASYRLDYGAGLYPQAWTQIGSAGSQPVSEGLLIQWDTAGLHGLYILRLQVVTRDNLLRTVYVPVTVGE